MNGKLTASRAELAAEKAARNRGSCRGSGPDHPPKKFGLARSRLLGRLAGREATSRMKKHHEGSSIPQEEGGVFQGEEVACFYIKVPNLN